MLDGTFYHRFGRDIRHFPGTHYTFRDLRLIHKYLEVPIH
jgi:hypothetical protein